MEAFMNPDVIAGVILAFYFFARAATSLFDRKNGNGKIADATYKVEMRSKMDTLQEDIKELKRMLDEWDDRIHQGEFTSPWTDREVGEVLEIMRRIDRNLH